MTGTRTRNGRLHKPTGRVGQLQITVCLSGVTSLDHLDRKPGAGITGLFRDRKVVERASRGWGSQALREAPSEVTLCILYSDDLGIIFRVIQMSWAARLVCRNESTFKFGTLSTGMDHL